METEGKKLLRLTDEEKGFFKAYISQRPNPDARFSKEEAKALVSQLKECSGIERTVGAVYMHLRRLSGRTVEPDKERILLKFHGHLQELEKCFSSMLEKKSAEDEERVGFLQKEVQRLKNELAEAHDELRELTPLRAAVEEIKKRKRKRGKVPI